MSDLWLFPFLLFSSLRLIVWRLFISNIIVYLLETNFYLLYPERYLGFERWRCIVFHEAHNKALNFRYQKNILRLVWFVLLFGSGKTLDANEMVPK